MATSTAISTSTFSLNQDQLKVLEQTRQRLVQLTHSLGSLAASLQQSDPLPSWTSLQSQSSIISNNLISVSEQLSEHHDLLSSLVAYPGATFPGHTQAGFLEQLLRTKLEPKVQDWVARGRAAGVVSPSSSPSSSDLAYGGVSQRHNNAAQLSADLTNFSLSERQLTELWEWAPIAANREARRRDWGGDFTLEEREMGVQNVVTGLRRRLDEEEDDEDDEEDEEDEGEREDDGEQGKDVGERTNIVAARRRPGGADLEFDVASERSQAHTKADIPPMLLGDVLRFMMTGAQTKSTR